MSKSKSTEFVNLSDVNEGDILIADGGFACLAKSQKCLVKKNDAGLYVECSDGGHHLDGQLDDNNHLIGFRK